MIKVIGWAVSAGLLFIGCSQSVTYEESEGIPTTTIADTTAPFGPPKPEPKLNEYGIAKDSVMEEQGRVQRNDNLALILGRYDVPYSQIHRLSQESEGVFNLRRIRQGNSYRFYSRENGSGTEPLCLVYHKNASDYVVFHFGDETRVETGSLPREVRTREVSGAINSSLYNALRAQDISPLLVNRLAEVFAWQVDFFRIREGDAFKVIYEEIFVNGTKVGIGDIITAKFDHHDRPYYAIRFEQDGRAEYFDEEGNNLRRQFLRAPIEFTRISSGFSHSRRHPVHGRNVPHHGTDYAAPTGTPIYAIGDGVIEAASYTRGNGNYVTIRHNSTYTTMYLHMSRFASGIRPGKRVEQKDLIGYVGSTGLATGPHVCFRMYKHGAPVNSRQIEMPPSEPVEEENMEAFKVVRDEMMQKLELVGTLQAYLESTD